MEVEFRLEHSLTTGDHYVLDQKVPKDVFAKLCNKADMAYHHEDEECDEFFTGWEIRNWKWDRAIDVMKSEGIDLVVGAYCESIPAEARRGSGWEPYDPGDLYER